MARGMKVSELLQYLRENPEISLNIAAKNLGIDRNTIITVARIGGIELATVKSKREICSNAPESCFSCPFSDCISNKHVTVRETKLITDSIGLSEHSGQSQKRRKK